ncbi:hypothetical protein PoB_002378300 [Plakobranchus ocellatus]|uniref:G-protein coupled receptors family 1 profile domain-containing protein n=1 Tax=Plakobranchus ocellatus TaxID=259542 RepID=A0AAV3ZR15_9GAST|nr:hypothetical protein PoB_002378300 [Plakobranchus ocellatus]
MENSTNASLLWQEQEKLLQYSSFHNTWFAATGFIANSLSVVLIWCSSGLRQHQRLNMLSLTLNDLVFMASVFIYGLLPVIGQVQLAREICWPIIYVTMATSTVSSMTITHITVVGFLAVSRPWDFRKFTTTKRVLSIVICIWCLSWATAMAYFKFDLPIQTRGCSLFLLMPRDGLIVWLFVNITCSFLVIILNIKIIFYLHVRKRVRISETNAPETRDRPDSSPSPDTSGQSEPGPSRADRATYHTPIQPLCSKYTNARNAPDRFELAECGYRKQAKALVVRNTTSTSSSDEQDSNNIPNMVHARTGSLTEHDQFTFVYSGVHRLQVPTTFSEARVSYQGHYKSADRTCASSNNKQTDFISAQKLLACPLKSIRTDGINRNHPRNLANHQEQQIAEPQLKKTERKRRTQINVQ